jgi:hypothetical protein
MQRLYSAFGFNARRVRLIDCSPARDVSGSDNIRRASEPAGYTGEERLGGTIALINATAYRTGSRGITRVNQNHPNACQLGLVFDKLAKLVEPPRVLLATLNLLNRYPASDATEVFEGYSPSGAFGLRHKLLGDAMVHITGESALFCLSLAKKSFGWSSLFRLEFLTNLSIAIAESVKMPTAENLTIAIGSYVDYAKIDAKILVGCIWRWFVNFTDNIQVEFAVVIEEIGLPLACLKEFTLSVSGKKRDTFPACHSPDGDIVGVVAKYPIIIGDAAVPPESSHALLVFLIGVSDLDYAHDNHLSRETKPFLYIIVEEFLQLVLGKRFGFPSHFADIVACLISTLDGAKKDLGLLRCGCESYVSNQLHTWNIQHSRKNVKS